MPPVSFLGPQVRVSADTIVSLPGRAVSVVNPDGTLSDRLHQYLYTVGTTINNVTPGSGYAPLTSPGLEGVPTTPTPFVGITTNQIVNAAWVAETFAAPPALGSGTPNTVYSTGGALNGSLGESTANIAAFTVTQTATAHITDAQVTTLEASGLITPTSTIGIAGTTTNDNAQAGSIGEYVDAQATITPVASTPANVVSISLTAGDWDISIACSFLVGAGATATSIIAGASTTTATLPAQPDLIELQSVSLLTGAVVTQSTMPVRFSLAASTTVYLVASYAATGGTVSVSGHIRARRTR